MVSAEGAFGSVYVAQLTPNFRVAVKVMKDEVTVNSQYREQFQNEVQLLQSCRHPHVLSLLGHCLDGPSPCLVYEYKSRGSLRGLLSARHEALSFTRRLTMLQQIASGLEYMHVVSQPPVIHRDIKTLNILVDDYWNCSIGDFGIARLSSEAGSAASGSGRSTRVLGTPGYIDPEYVQSGEWTCHIYMFCCREADSVLLVYTYMLV